MKINQGVLSSELPNTQQDITSSKEVIQWVKWELSLALERTSRDIWLDNNFFTKLEGLSPADQVEIIRNGCKDITELQRIYERYLQFIYESYYLEAYELPKVVSLLKNDVTFQKASIHYVRANLKSLSSDQLTKWDIVINFCLNILSFGKDHDFIRNIEDDSFGLIESLIDACIYKIEILQNEYLTIVSTQDNSLEWIAQISTSIEQVREKNICAIESELILQIDRIIEIFETINKMALSRTSNKSNKQIETVLQLRNHLDRAIQVILNSIAKILQIELYDISDYHNIWQIKKLTDFILDILSKKTADKWESHFCLKEQTYKLIYLLGKLIANFHGIKELPPWLSSLQIDEMTAKKLSAQNLAFDIKKRTQLGNPQDIEMIRTWNQIRDTLRALWYKKSIHGTWNGVEKSELEMNLVKLRRIFIGATHWLYDDNLVIIESSDLIIRAFAENEKDQKSVDQLEIVCLLTEYDQDISLDSIVFLVAFFVKSKYDNSQHEEYKFIILWYCIERLSHNFGDEKYLESIQLISNYLEVSKNTTCSPQSYAKIYMSLANYYLGRATLEKKASESGLLAIKFFYYSISLSWDRDMKLALHSDFCRRLGILCFKNNIGTNGEKISLPVSEYTWKEKINSVIKDIEKESWVRVVTGIDKKRAMIQNQQDFITQKDLDIIVGEVLEMMVKEIFYEIGHIEVISLSDEVGECNWKKCRSCAGNNNGKCRKKRPGPFDDMIDVLEWFILHYYFPYQNKTVVSPIFEREKSVIKDKMQLLLNEIANVMTKQKDQIKINRLAFNDTETGLPNNNKLKEDLKIAEWLRQTPTVLFLEVPDYYIITNTTGGERAWEERMKQVLQILQQKDSVNRVTSPVKEIYRKDDFTFAIVSDGSHHEVQSFIELLPRGAFLPYMGMVAWETDDILLKTGIALSKAKKFRKLNGDTSIYSFRDGDQEELNKLKHNTSILREALDEKNEMVRLVPYYQPICDSNGTIVKFEALARIEIEEDGEIKVISPWNFIPIAEANGWSPEVTAIMLRKIQEDLRNNPEIQISINIDAQDWNNDGIKQTLENLNQQGISQRITLEILETVRLNREEDVLKIQELRASNFILAVDDYGTGESHAYRIAQVKPEVLKIDGIIVTMLQDTKTKKDGINLIEEAVSTAKRFNAETYAEYVKSKEILEILKKCGVNYFQGEYFGMAEPLSKFASPNM